MCRILILIVVMLFSSSVSAKVFKVDESNQREIYDLYGILYYQESFLDKIEDNFPDLKERVSYLRSLYDYNYKDALFKVESALYSSMGNQFNAIKGKFKDDIDNIILNSHLNKDNAINFINELELNINSNFDQEMLKNLIGIVFYDKPDEEFDGNKVQVYELPRYPNTHQYQLSMKVPYSWQSRSLGGRLTSKRWFSEMSAGVGSIQLIVQQANEMLDNVAIKRIISSEEIRDFVPNEAIIIKSEMSVIDNKPALLIDMEIPTQVNGVLMYYLIRQYNLVHEDNLYSIGCMIFTEGAVNNELYLGFERIKNLCNQVSNSVIVPLNI